MLVLGGGGGGGGKDLSLMRYECCFGGGGKGLGFKIAKIMVICLLVWLSWQQKAPINL